MTSAVSKEESVVVEQGIAPVLWAIHTLQQREWPVTQHNVLELANTFDEVPESVIVEGFVLIERMEYENQCLFSDIMTKLQVDSEIYQRAFGRMVGLAAARIVDRQSSLGTVKVPHLDVSECQFLDDLDELLEASVAQEYQRSARSY